MRVFPNVTVDEEFTTLGGSGTLNDRQFAYLRSQGRLGALADMMGSAPAYTPSTWLTGKKGFWIDPSDSTRLWQDSTGTTPATGATDPVGRILCQGPAASTVFDQTVSASRATRSSNRLFFDAVDDFYEGNATVDGMLNNSPGAAFLWRGNITSLVEQSALIRFSTGVSLSGSRFHVRVNTTGAILVFYSRLDADLEVSVQSPVGQIIAGTDNTIEVYINYAVGGVGALEMIVNGVTVHTATVAGTGNTSATDSQRARLGRNISQSPVMTFNGTMGRMVFANAVPVGTDRTDLRTWVNGGT